MATDLEDAQQILDEARRRKKLNEMAEVLRLISDNELHTKRLKKKLKDLDEQPLSEFYVEDPAMTRKTIDSMYR